MFKFRGTLGNGQRFSGETHEDNLINAMKDIGSQIPPDTGVQSIRFDWRPTASKFKLRPVPTESAAGDGSAPKSRRKSAKK